jgi:hypothetical protein
MSQKLYHSFEWLKLRFVTQRKTIEEMATEAKVVPMTIRRALESNGLISKL